MLFSMIIMLQLLAHGVVYQVYNIHITYFVCLWWGMSVLHLPALYTNKCATLQIGTSQIMGSIQLGIHQAVGSLASIPELDVLIQDFYVVETICFPPNGSETTPAHPYSDYRLVLAPYARLLVPCRNGVEHYDVLYIYVSVSKLCPWLSPVGVGCLWDTVWRVGWNFCGENSGHHQLISVIYAVNTSSVVRSI